MGDSRLFSLCAKKSERRCSRMCGGGIVSLCLFLHKGRLRATRNKRYFSPRENEQQKRDRPRGNVTQWRGRKDDFSLIWEGEREET